jgi:hypothetical protein
MPVPLGRKPEGLPDGAFRALFDANPAPMWVYDAETRQVLAANRLALDSCAKQFTTMTLLHEGGQGVLQHHRRDGTTVSLRLDISHIDIAGRTARCHRGNTCSSLERA